MATLTIRNEHLRIILDALHAAAAPCLEDKPSSFMETIRITDSEGGLLTFVTTDGFRAHIAEINANIAEIELGGEIVIGAEFLGKVSALLGDDDEVTITATSSHTKWTVTANGHEQVFTLPEWPDMHRLISDEVLGEEEVAFNLDYFHDMIDAFDAWHDEVEEEGSMIPLRVHSMQRKRVNHFSMKNEMGTLRILLMPIILKDSEWR